MRNANHACKFFPGSLSTFSHREGQLVVAASCRNRWLELLRMLEKSPKKIPPLHCWRLLRIKAILWCELTYSAFDNFWRLQHCMLVTFFIELYFHCFHFSSFLSLSLPVFYMLLPPTLREEQIMMWNVSSTSAISRCAETVKWLSFSKGRGLDQLSSMVQSKILREILTTMLSKKHQYIWLASCYLWWKPEE